MRGDRQQPGDVLAGLPRGQVVEHDELAARQPDRLQAPGEHLQRLRADHGAHPGVVGQARRHREQVGARHQRERAQAGSRRLAEQPLEPRGGLGGAAQPVQRDHLEQAELLERAAYGDLGDERLPRQRQRLVGPVREQQEPGPGGGEHRLPVPQREHRGGVPGLTDGQEQVGLRGQDQRRQLRAGPAGPLLGGQRLLHDRVRVAPEQGVLRPRVQHERPQLVERVPHRQQPPERGARRRPVEAVGRDQQLGDPDPDPGPRADPAGGGRALGHPVQPRVGLLGVSEHGQVHRQVGGGVPRGADVAGQRCGLGGLAQVRHGADQVAGHLVDEGSDEEDRGQQVHDRGRLGDASLASQVAQPDRGLGRLVHAAGPAQPEHLDQQDVDRRAQVGARLRPPGPPGRPGLVLARRPQRQLAHAVREVVDVAEPAQRRGPEEARQVVVAVGDQRQPGAAEDRPGHGLVTGRQRVLEREAGLPAVHEPRRELGVERPVVLGAEQGAQGGAHRAGPVVRRLAVDDGPLDVPGPRQPGQQRRGLRLTGAERQRGRGGGEPLGDREPAGQGPLRRGGRSRPTRPAGRGRPGRPPRGRAASRGPGPPRRRPPAPGRASRRWRRTGRGSRSPRRAMPMPVQRSTATSSSSSSWAPSTHVARAASRSTGPSSTSPVRTHSTSRRSGPASCSSAADQLLGQGVLAGVHDDDAAAPWDRVPRAVRTELEHLDPARGRPGPDQRALAEPGRRADHDQRVRTVELGQQGVRQHHASTAEAGRARCRRGGSADLERAEDHAPTVEPRAARHLTQRG